MFQWEEKEEGWSNVTPKSGLELLCRHWQEGQPHLHRAGDPVLLSSCVHGEISTLLLWSEDSGIILPPFPPHGRGSLPAEVGGLTSTGQVPLLGLGLLGLGPRGWSHQGWSLQPAVTLWLCLLAGGTPFQPVLMPQISNPKLGYRISAISRPQVQVWLTL